MNAKGGKLDSLRVVSSKTNSSSFLGLEPFSASAYDAPLAFEPVLPPDGPRDRACSDLGLSGSGSLDEVVSDVDLSDLEIALEM